jgi:hypothetical protein
VVVTIRLNRPPMNVLSDRLQAALAGAASADAAGVTLTPWA